MRPIIAQPKANCLRYLIVSCADALSSLSGPCATIPSASSGKGRNSTTLPDGVIAWRGFEFDGYGNVLGG
jgi:hypothetical protein